MHRHGRLSAGAEAYLSPINKSFGISTGLRFSTLAIHPGFPYTMTLTLNPLMGNLRATYAVAAGPRLAFCSRFDFNVYSYESAVVVGVELWRRRRRRREEEGEGVEWAVRRMREKGWSSSSSWSMISPPPPSSEVESDREDVNHHHRELMHHHVHRDDHHDENDGVIKARVDNHGRIGLAWEGRAKDLLLSLGADIHLHRPQQPLASIGLEVSYSS